MAKKTVIPADPQYEAERIGAPNSITGAGIEALKKLANTGIGLTNLAVTGMLAHVGIPLTTLATLPPLIPSFTINDNELRGQDLLRLWGWA